MARGGNCNCLLIVSGSKYWSGVYWLYLAAGILSIYRNLGFFRKPPGNFVPAVFLCNCRSYRNDSLVLTNEVELKSFLKCSNWTGEGSGNTSNALNLG